MAYSMTPARRAALKKAQAASARKRRGKGKGKLAAANRKNGISRKRKMIGYSAVAVGYGLIGYAAIKQHKENRSRAHTKKLQQVKYDVDHDAVRRIVGSAFHSKGLSTNSEISAARRRR
jgi:hypothetical protein